MPDEMPRRWGPVPVVILLMLAGLTLTQSAPRLADPGIDFYQFWGVPVAMRLSGHTLGTPYRNGQRYSAVLKDYAAGASQPKLTAVNRFWSGPDFAGSPFLYTVFALVSSDYTSALGVFRLLQIASFLVAFLLLGYLYRFDPFHLICLALLCLLFYQPLLSDLRVANLGSLQLVALTGLLVLASALPRVPSFVPRVSLGALLLVALTVVTLSKPNVALIAALLAVHLGVRHGARLFVAAALPAALVGAALLILPCLYFGSWSVWREWYDFVYRSDAYMLVRRVEHGNYSTVVLLSSWLGLDVYVVVAVVATLLAASLIAVAVGVRRSRTSTPLRSRAAALVALARLCHDPRRAAAIGIVLTMAISPLYWLHYYVLALIPSLWLLNAHAPSKSPGALAAAAMVMSSGMLGLLLWWLGWPAGLPASIALSWFPLWCALLVSLRLPDTEVVRAPGSVGEAGRATSEVLVAPVSRRRRK